MLYSNMESSSLQTSSTKSELNDIDKEKEKQARENHCEIERRRRVKMAAYFNELCSMVPTCNSLQRKPDKLTILRMASSHMRALRGHHQMIANDNTYKPSFLTDQELKYLILEAADGFLFVAQCDSGNIIYVSDAIQPVLCYSPNDWYHRSLFDFIHNDDLEKVKEQLSSQETNTIGRILDLKTGTVKKEGNQNSMRSHMGSRRAFICRLRVGGNYEQPQQPLYSNNNQNSFNYLNRTNIHQNALGEPNTNLDGGNYAVVHITGYTKTWPPTNGQQQQMVVDIHDTNNNNGGGDHNQFCLIAIARIQVTNMPNDTISSSNLEFVTRLDQNGVVTFVDQKITQILGYQTVDVLKKPIYDICSSNQDQNVLKEQIKLLFETKSSQPILMQLHIKSINQEIYTFKTSSYAFSNPYNDEFEFIVCTHQLQKPNDINNSVLLDQQTTPSTPLTATTSTTNPIVNNNNNYSMQQQQHSTNNSYMMPINTNDSYLTQQYPLTASTSTTNQQRVLPTPSSSSTTSSLSSSTPPLIQSTWTTNYDQTTQSTVTTVLPPQSSSSSSSSSSQYLRQYNQPSSYNDWNSSQQTHILNPNWQQQMNLVPQDPQQQPNCDLLSQQHHYQQHMNLQQQQQSNTQNDYSNYQYMNM